MAIGIWALALVGALAALVQAMSFYKWMNQADPGNARMVEIAGFVRTGAYAYLRQQYKVVAFFFVVICLLFVLAAYAGVQSPWVPVAFLTGGFFSGLAGYFGMKTATLASNRTAAGAQKSLNQGLQVAFRAGAVMGLTVVGLGLLDICLWFAILYWLVPIVSPGNEMSLIEITVTMLCFGMGASSQALFARVGGGIFTKAADVGADLVGKVEHSIPEDDARNPATIADNVGDNVGDVAGMGADLYESYCGSILATAALGVAAFVGNPEMQLRALFLPMALAAVGTLLSIAGIYMVKTDENSSLNNLLKALARGINFSTVCIIGASFALCYVITPDHWKVSLSVITGLLAGWLIGKWTEYSTSYDYKPTQGLADQALTGPATIIIGGVAEGMISTWVPVLVVGAATLLSFGFANDFNFSDPNQFALGLYGVGIAAVGMLSTLGITLATDAYGPIADNAGGNAQMSGLDPMVRERTDALDSLGNTTAATGKGFAIGSAALTALALLAAYIEEVRIGYERWGTVVAENVEGTPEQYLTIGGQRTMLREGQFVKLTKGVIVKLGPEPRKNEAILVLDGDAIPDFAKLPNDSVLPAGFSETELIAEKRMVPVHSATMADFMRYYDVTLMNPKVLVGLFVGAMSVFVFCALTMKAVGRAAKGMVEEVRRQFREKPGIMAGTDIPDYAAPVAISTKAAQREMILPSLLALIVPVVTGMLLDVSGIMGLLVGGLTCGFCVAVFMANAGGAWDNAKKYIESGVHGGKGTEAHKAAVVGDTVGDPFKDTSGPSLNILIKLMSMVAVVAAGLIVRYSLSALGIF
ncbi:MAG: sodium-translocating pyrophosphatase [Planctomycetaceae bacterium]|nr:sodium-translocating pyrophosphatase [Planctomycetaceae bacterium]